ncbi:MAG: malectin domain-containing carbohydrate-binding protein, partial [Planctomycetales bacterium]
RVWNDLLVVSVFDSERQEGRVPTKLLALDRQSGKIAWSHLPEASCPIVAIGKKHLYYFDGQIEALYNDIGRGGIVPKTGTIRKIRALDAATGKEVWNQDTPMVVTWLAHSADHDVLVASNHEKVQARRGKSGEFLWDRTAKSKGFLGHPESRWDRVILWNDKIIDQRGPGVQYFIETGEPIQINHPISGEPVNWEFTAHGHHCNYAIANQHMMTFRAGSAGFTDLKNVTTGRFEGFRTGCRNSLIPAGGILNAPNFGHGCTCSYSLFTSLALTHLPEMDTWSYSAMTPPEGPVSRVGINLAAPGDRQADNGTLWLDFPAVGQHNYRLPNVSGPSPDIPVSLVGSDDLKWFREHPSQLEGEEEAWIAASGAEGLRSMTISLGEEVREKRAYQVRLYFAEPNPITAGERVFSVALEGDTVLENLDVVKETGGPKRIMVKQFDHVVAGSDLTIDLTPVAGQTLLCGVEVVAEE